MKSKSLAAFKGGFFDAPRIAAHAEKTRLRALSRTGGRVRLRARRSLRRRKSPGAPGSPPSVHSDDAIATLKAIYYAYDSATRSLVVGPLALNMVDHLNGQAQAGVAPALHEAGGTRGVLEVLTSHGWIRVDKRRARRPDDKRPRRMRSARYPARPFMRPALGAELPTFREAMKPGIAA